MPLDDLSETIDNTDIPQIATLVVRAPKYSFVAPPTNAVVACHGLCLPVVDVAEMRFQSLITSIPQVVVDESAPPDFKERFFYAVALKDVECNQFPSTAPLPVMYEGKARPIGDVSEYVSVIDFALNNGSNTWAKYNARLIAKGFEPINPGDCFKLFIYSEIMDCQARPCSFVSRHLHYCTTCFQRIEDSCYTSLIEYKSNENGMDFFYFDDDGDPLPPQRIRLPFYLKEPQLTADSDTLTLSNQAIVKLYEVISREYTLETENMPFEWHTKLKVALAHDSVKITNINLGEHEVPGKYGFSSDDGYKIKWQKHPSLLGKGEVKVTHADAVALRNLNCG